MADARRCILWFGLLALLISAVGFARSEPRRVGPDPESELAALPSDGIPDNVRAIQPAEAPAETMLPIVMRRVKTDRPYVAVTVDDFITADYRKRTAIRIMQAANDAHVTLTLCPAGAGLAEYARNHPDQAAEIKRLFYTGSFELCDHTYAHPYMDKLALTAQESEMTRGQTAIRDFFGRNPSPIFRPPFGHFNGATVQAAAQMGFSHVVLWSQDTRDSVGPEKPASALLANVSKAAAGDIILTHANRGSSAEAMPMIIQMLHKKGLELVSLSVLIASGQPSN